MEYRDPPLTPLFCEGGPYDRLRLYSSLTPLTDDAPLVLLLAVVMMSGVQLNILRLMYISDLTVASLLPTVRQFHTRGCCPSRHCVARYPQPDVALDDMHCTTIRLRVVGYSPRDGPAVSSPARTSHMS